MEPAWPMPPGVRALSTLRRGGVSVGRYDSLNLGDHVDDEPSRVAENRRRLAASANLPAEPSWLTQVHGTAVADLDVPGIPGPADAAVTRQPGRVCAVLTADCLPIIVAAQSGEAVAVVHAGWRGLAAGVIESAIRAVGMPGDQLQAWLGPAIGPQNFEVGEEVRAAFVSSDERTTPAFQVNCRGRFMANLGALARQRLKDLGILRVYGGGFCTYADPQRFFSHRRDGLTGRQATLIWLETDKNR